jgi:hypothetical protein
MSISPEEFHRKTRELSELYFRIRELIILSENIDEKKEIYIAPLNELRSSLDHLFKANTATNQIEFDNSFEQVKEHLYRAGYDTFEVLGSNLGTYIVKNFNNYDSDTITKIYPEYYRIIKPFLVECQTVMADIRNARKSHSINYEYFDKYYNVILPLIDHYKASSRMIPSLEECKRKDKRKAARNRIWQIVIPIFCTILSFLIGYYFSCNKNNSTNTNPQDTSRVIIKR